MLHYSVLFSLAALLAGIPALLPIGEVTSLPALDATGLAWAVCGLFAGLAAASAAAALVNRH